MISIEFIFFFLPIFIGLYALTPAAHRGRLISLGAAVVIAWGSPWGLITFGVSVLTAYLGGIFIFNFRERRVLQRLFFLMTVLINVFCWAVFSYPGIGGGAGLLPVRIPFISGITSFGAGIYTLNAVSYCSDVYHGRCISEHRFSSIFRFIGFFPAFTLGPMLSFDPMREKLRAPKLSLSGTASGIARFLLGLFRKLIFANSMYEMWRDVQDVGTASLPMMTAWLGMIAFGLFLYFETAAWSDMAIGLGQMLGFRIAENVRMPSHASSFHGFFRRMNYSLYRWLRKVFDFGTKDASRTSLKKLISSALCLAAGTLWYTRSPGSLSFALIMMLFILVEKIFGHRLKKMPGSLSRLILFTLLVLSLPFLAFGDPVKSVSYLAAMMGSNTVAADMVSEYIINSYILYLLPALMSFCGLFRLIKNRLLRLGDFFMTIIQPIVCLILLVICTSFIVSVDDSLLGCLI